MTPEAQTHRQPAAATSDHPLETPAAPVRRRFEDLPPAAQRALLEAEARRREIDARAAGLPPEVDGRGGLEPTRYDDWEIKGIACDF